MDQPQLGNPSEWKLRARGLGERAVDLVKRRPILSLGLLAAAGLLSGAEWLFGAVLGLGAAGLFTTQKGHDLRKDLGERARHYIDQAREARRPRQPI